MNRSKRQFLKRGLATATLFLPVPYAWVWAQSEGTMKLLKLPKIALVMGNSNYKGAPLANPANDARAMAAALKATGFDVTLRMDAGRSDMASAVQTYSTALASTKGVGLFYYAGHGVQLAWRNYMMPVDADINTIADIQNQGVEVNVLLAGITKAANAMNIIILDACRDNPFGDLKGIEQKGLSQMDAPESTLLAYATSPGNVASDGEGSNGLYTENLLREIKVPEAKVEDVFKRVRLGVRLKSKGAQIPWESTSLEEDFWFVPPRSLAIIVEEDVQRQRKEQQALLDKRLAQEAAERKRKQEEALRQAKLAAEQAERQRQQELAALEQKRIAEEAERKRNVELALKDAQRAAEEVERKRRQEQALREAKLAEEEAARRQREALAAIEKQRAQEEAERRRREEQALREARLAEEEAARRQREELAALEKRRLEEDLERKRRQSVVAAPEPAAEAERRFQQELAIWEKAKNSKGPQAFEDYLFRYPSGQFSELAQLRLDQELAQAGEKKVLIASSQGNPFTKGSSTADTNYKIGDSYTYRRLDILSRVEQGRYTEQVVQITDQAITFSGGTTIDLLGNSLRARDGRTYGDNQNSPLEFAVGKRWSTRFKVTSGGRTGEGEQEFRITRREQITVPAGTFNAFVVEGSGFARGTRPDGRPVDSRSTRWFAPEYSRRPVAAEDNRRAGSNIIALDRVELVSFNQA